MKFKQYLMEKYGMTTEVFKSKPDWAKEELHKEHEAYLREVQIQAAAEKRWNALSDQERENISCYNMLVEEGIPQTFIDQIFEY